MVDLMKWLLPVVALLPIGGASGVEATSASAPLRAVVAVGTASAADAHARGRYRLPVAGRGVVNHPFAPPSRPYGPGHLGVDLLTTPGAAVLAAGPGEVVFAGPVAGRGVVVVLHPDGLSTEYEPIVPVVRTGSGVVAGRLIGRVSGTHRGCKPGSCLHWGARRGPDYLDPLSLLRGLGPVRLLPWAGPP
jgi:murein DD-endopeptidase MepM/ murein hydrolase activator NlpD